MKKSTKNIYYDIGLDIGTNSVGYAVTDIEGNLVKIKGKNFWGVRLFDEGKTAATRRLYRSTRRRKARRKQRIKLLQQIFHSEIAAVDPDFYKRLKASFLHK
ncbi:MAG: type II CRISPR RNA-guided endonuclease Cas9, partial [Bacilli bacterium]